MFQSWKLKIVNLLRRSERYTKTDMVYLARGGFWLTLGQAVSSLSSFLLAVAFANLLPPETYGIYKYVLSVAAILAIPTLQGMGTAITQAVARGYEGSFIPALKTKMRWGILGGIASLGVAGYYYIQGNETLMISFLIASLFLPVMDSFGIYESLLAGKKLFNVISKYGIITKILSFVALVTALISTNNIFIILLIYFGSYTLLRFIFLWLTLTKYLINTRVDSGTISYGKHLSLMSVITIISQRIDGVLIFHYLGATELAIYAFAIAPPEQIKGVLKNVITLAIPKFSLQSKELIKLSIMNKIKTFAAIATLIVLLYVYLAPYLYRLFFPQYLDSVFYSQVFAVSIIAAGLFLPYAALESQAAQKHLYIYHTVTSLIQITLLIILIIPLGILGAILARVMYRFINLIFSMILVKRI